MSVFLVLLLEFFFFSKAYMLADRATVGIVHKANLIKSKEADIILLGQSRTMAINAKSLEELSQRKTTVYNYANPSLGTSLQFYLVLKKYLKYHKKPKMIFISIPPEYFDLPELRWVFEYAALGKEGVDLKRFVRFFDMIFMLENVPFKEKWLIVKEYTNHLLPSFNYRTFVRERFINMDFKKVYLKNKKIVNNLSTTNGQLIINGKKIVSLVDLQRHMPISRKYKEQKNTNFERLLDLIEKNRIPIVFFFMPICESRYSRMENLGWFEYFDRLFKEYENKYEYFTFLKINTKYKREFFGDYSHLNQKGAEKFNKEFGEYFEIVLSESDLYN